MFAGRENNPPYFNCAESEYVLTNRLVILLLLSFISLPAPSSLAQTPASARSPVKPQTARQPANKELAAQVRAEFLHAWNGYKKYAWGHDDLRPLSKTYHDWYAEPLLMTPVDSLDTMIIMDLKDEATSTKHARHARVHL